MASPVVSDPPTVVGYVEYPVPPGYTQATHPIFIERALLIGRKPQYELSLDEPTISNKHMRIYCIIYDKNDNTIKPLVYAEDLSSNGSYWNGSFIGKGNGGCLLSDGDELRLSPRITLTFHTSIKYAEERLNLQQQAEVKHFQDYYHITTRSLGAGANGSVYMAINVVQGHQVACKVVDLKKIHLRERSALKRFNATRDKTYDNSSTSLALRKMSKVRIKRSMDAAASKVTREFEILKNINHPNIVHLEKAYRSDDNLYIFEELVTGGDLFSYIEYRGGVVPEAEVGCIVQQISHAIRFLHQRDIVHRDLKPDNILIASLAQGARVVLTDFGSAIQGRNTGAHAMRRMDTIAGSLEYVAPEVHGANAFVKLRGYTKAVDMWSLGCVTTALLTGATPFSINGDRDDARNLSEVVLQSASSCQLDGLYELDAWATVSGRAKDFIKKLLVLNEHERMTAEHAMEHDWFTNKYVKQTLDAVYERAVVGWKSTVPAQDVIESLPGTVISPKSGARRVKQRTPKPIEPHYHPYHRRLEVIISPRLGAVSTDIEKVKKNWEETISRSDNIASSDVYHSPPDQLNMPLLRPCLQNFTRKKSMVNDESRLITETEPRKSLISSPTPTPKNGKLTKLSKPRSSRYMHLPSRKQISLDSPMSEKGIFEIQPDPVDDEFQTGLAKSLEIEASGSSKGKLLTLPFTAINEDINNVYPPSLEL